MENRWLMVAGLALLAACGTPPQSESDAGMFDAGRNPDGFVPMADTGPPGCASDTECDDGVDCTSDTCTTGTGVCRHQVVPALCPTGSSCHPTHGCEMGRACGTNADCEDDDACTVNERCDPAARTCVVDPLDGDGDGDLPRVCGGGDCDDSRGTVHSGATETCNDIDDDCDGAVDEDVMAATCALCRTASACGHQDMADCYQRMETQLAGRGCLNADSIRATWSTCTADCTGYLSCRDDASASCTCPAGQVFCNTSPVAYCIDLSTDLTNCGECRNACPAGTTCTSGTCRCPTGQTLCGTACVDTSSDAMNCGTCGNACATGSVCTSGTCRCPTGQTLCGTACVDTSSDAMNCGTCEHRCPFDITCASGMCQCPTGQTECPSPFGGSGTTCADTSSDVYHCGACSVECAREEYCASGTCVL